MINLGVMPFNPELLGILATMFVVVAFSLSGEVRIRIFDLVGAVLFVAYGFIIDSFSTMLLNGILVLIHIVKLYKACYGKQKNVYTKNNGE